MKKIVTDYLLNTRKQYESIDLSSYLKKLYELIDLFLSAEEINCIYVTSLSKQRHCECLISNEKWCLIYDQYMGETLFVLNKLFFGGKSFFEAGYSYVHKLIGEFLSVRGHNEDALTCAFLYHNNKKDSHHGEYDKIVEEYLVPQQFFIMAHELHHMLFRKNKSLWKNAEYQYNYYIDCRKQQYKRFKEMAVAERFDLYSKDFQQKWHSKEDLEEHLKFNDPDFESEVELLTIETLEHDENLKEEICCDFLALSLTVSVMTEKYKMNIKDILKAVYLSFYHLRSIRNLEVACLEYIRDKKYKNISDNDAIELMHSFQKQKFNVDLSIRCHAMLNKCLDMYTLCSTSSFQDSLSKTAMSNKHKFHEELLGIPELYYITIFDGLNQVIGYSLLQGGLNKETDRMSKNDSEYRFVNKNLEIIKKQEGPTQVNSDLCSMFGGPEIQFPNYIFYNFDPLKSS